MRWSRPWHESGRMAAGSSYSGPNFASIAAITQARRVRMTRLRMIGLALAAALAAGQANAEELTGTLKKIKETGTITIGYRDSSIPFSYLDDNQKPIGFAIDICGKIVDSVKNALKLDNLACQFKPVTAST